MIGWRQWFVQYSRRGTELPSDANYRALSLTSVACKVLEWILKRAILLFIIECNAIADFRHGFLPRRSCLSNLMILEKTIRWLMDDGNTADVVNFAKAFHLVINRFLLTQLGSFGLCEKSSDGSDPIRREEPSEWKWPMRCRTRQGSRAGHLKELVIGPLLYLLFVNELPHAVKPYHRTVRFKYYFNYHYFYIFNAILLLVWRRRLVGLTTLTKRPFGELPPKMYGTCRLIGTSLLIPRNPTILFLGGLLHFNYSLLLEVRAIPYRSQAVLKTWAFLWTAPSHPVKRGCIEGKINYFFW